MRVSLLGTLTFLLAMPWLTSTGCSGDQPPSTSTGFELLQETLRTDPVFWLAPLGLFVAALVGIAALRVRRPGRRFLVVLLQLPVVVASAFFTLLAVELPRVADTITHEFAGVAGAVVVVALVLEALVRVGLGVRELWVGRKMRLREDRFTAADHPSPLVVDVGTPRCF
jgi:hypothetical protein